MHLAQELVDYIIDFFHDDRTELIRVSLVSRAWVSRARTHLCESLKITSRKLSSLNPSYLTPLCGYVKTLHFTWPRDLTDPPAVLDCFELSELHTLVIYSWELPILGERTVRRCFAKFPRASIITLELRDISLAHRTSLILLSVFPNVDNLMISVDHWWAEKPIRIPLANDQYETVQRVSLPRLRGCFKFLDAPDQGVSDFHSTLRTIATFPPQFQTVSLNIKEQSWEEVLDFLSSCSETVREIYIGLSHPNKQIDRPLPANFSNLEELHVSPWAASGPITRPAQLLLRSVASPRLRRVTVELRERDIMHIQWSLLDEILVNLVERHRACRNLALQISTSTDPERIRQSLPRVAQEGVLEVGPRKRPDYWASVVLLQ